MKGSVEIVMAENTNWYDEEEMYRLSERDVPGVLSSTRGVVEQGERVWINVEQIESFCERWLRQGESQQQGVQIWDRAYHFHDGTERTVNWIVLLDALNFCFWAEKGQTRWTVDYQGKRVNGYWAEAAALTRAVAEGRPLWDARYLSQIDEEAIAAIFRGDGTIPLLEERLNNAREVGRVLLERYDGQFSHAIEQAEGSASKLVLLLANEFPSFQDVATFRDQPVRFLKRAQICVADLHHAFEGRAWGAFRDLEQLTIFADYKLPQVLRHYHIIEYEPALAELIDNQELIPAGSEEEVEIRANTIWACEFLRRAMERRGQHMTAANIDQRLWLAGQQAAEMRPYHRTRTIYY